MKLLLDYDEIPEDLMKYFEPVDARSKPDVWKIATRSFKGAHFATYPPALVEPCIKAGTSERGVCPNCGKQWTRVVERTGRLIGEDRGGDYRGRDKPVMVAGQKTLAGGERYRPGSHYETIDLGWQPTCECDAEPIPATVLDPFSGAATTGLVCQQLNRNYVGLDLSMEYHGLARERLGLVALEQWQNGGDAVESDLSGLPMFS